MPISISPKPFFRRIPARILVSLLLFSYIFGFHAPPLGEATDVISTIPVGTRPWGVGVNDDTGLVYVANTGSATVSVINGTTNTVIATVGVGTSPRGVAVNPITNRIYVSNTMSDTVSVIDGSTNVVLQTISVWYSPQGIAVNPNTNRIYVAHSGSSRLSVIDGNTNGIAAIITVEAGPEGVAVNPRTNMIYVGNLFSDSVSVIDGVTNTVLTTLSVPDPKGIDVNANTNQIYVAQALASALAVIDGATNTVVTTISVGAAPRGVAVNPSTNRIYVANLGSGTVSVISGATEMAVSSIALPSPYWVAVNPNTNRIYVTNHETNTVSVINDGHQDVAPDQWPMFRHDSTRAGYSTSAAPNTNQTLWNYTAFWVSSSPAVVDRRVFVGSNDGYVYALNALTGDLVWRYNTGAVVSSSPAVADGRVYVGNNWGRVHALDALTGNLVWTYNTGAVVSSSPAVADGKVFVGSYDASVYALNALTGNLVWRYRTDAAVSSSPAVADGKVFVGSDDRWVYALNALTGDLIWRHYIGSEVRSALAVTGGKVYATAYGGWVFALDALTGDLVWTYSAAARVSSPAVAHGKVYVGSQDDRVLALDALTGDLVWSYTTGNNVDSSPAVADGKVFVGSYDASVYALNALTGNLVWRYRTDAAVSSSPAVADGRVYVGNHRGRVYAFGPSEPGVPVAAFTYTAQSEYVVTFDASASYDPDGVIERYDWVFGDEQIGNGMIVTHTYLYRAIYVVRLTITDNDGFTRSTERTVTLGNLRAVSIEPVQVVWGADLVKDKGTDFRIGYESTFDVTIQTFIELEVPGFTYFYNNQWRDTPYRFRYNFARGANTFVISSDIASSPRFYAITKPLAAYRFAIDPSNIFKETDETDNTFPRTDFGQSNVIDTKPLRMVFVRVAFEDEDVGFDMTSLSEHAWESDDYIKATYPLADPFPRVVYVATNIINAGERPTTESEANSRFNDLLKKLSDLAGSEWDRVVGVVRTNWFDGIPGWGGTIGFANQGSGKGAVVALGYWKTTAHEIGHTYNLNHSNDNGRGYYVLGRESVETQSFMSTGAIANPPAQQPFEMSVPSFWIRAAEYQVLLGKLKDSSDPEILLVSGTFFKNGTVILDDWYRFPSGTPDLAEGGIGNYSLSLLDSLGNIISTVRFNVTFVDELHGRNFEQMPFAFTVPYANATRTVQVVNASGHVVASKIISDNAPTVRVISPNGGEVLTSDRVQVSWEASDLDGDRLVYYLLISSDGGLTWTPMEVGWKQTSYDLSLAGLSGGSRYIVKVIASDGANTGEDVSDGFFTIAGFSINVVTPEQDVLLGGTAYYKLNITSYGGFGEPISMNASSTAADGLLFRWVNGSIIVPVPNGSTTATLEVQVPDVVTGRKHALVLSGTYGSNTQVAITYLFASSHDLVITDITPSEAVVGQGSSTMINVTVQNQGSFGETFTVSLYGNQTLILNRSTYLSPRHSTTLTFNWNTSGYIEGNYTISANAWPVPGEAASDDNLYVNGMVQIKLFPWIRWIRQFGTPAYEESGGIFVDASGVYVAGNTYGAFPNQTNAGGLDIFVRKYDFDGNVVWTRQFGSSFDDDVQGIAVHASGVYVVGLTGGTLPGQTSQGGGDAFVRMYDLDGNVVWTDQFGSPTTDRATGVSADASGVYVSGVTLGALSSQTSSGGADAFLRKYDFDGNVVWTRQFGTSARDRAEGVVVDLSGVYVAGWTQGIFPDQAGSGGDDAFVRKYDSSGNILWTRQFGTPASDRIVAISSDGSAIYVTGFTDGQLPNQTSAGSSDAFVRKYDVNGGELWTRQFGSPSEDYALGISADDSGVYVGGSTRGTLPNQRTAGGTDAFVRKYDRLGSEIWTQQFGTSEDEIFYNFLQHPYGISVGPLGLYVAGNTLGTLPDQTSSGLHDAFVAKFTQAAMWVRDFFRKDWADYDNDGKVTIIDVAHIAFVFDKPSSYWDINLNGIVDITDVAWVAFLFDTQFNILPYPGQGHPAGQMDGLWLIFCGELDPSDRDYCLKI